MLHFFRKIRHDLLANSKTYKYFKYAIGEIILVVLGILIALQINNWNEEMKNKQLETKILLEIKKGLNKDLSDITYNIEWHESVLRSQDIVVKWLSSNEPHVDSLNVHFSILSAFSVFLSREGPYENLKQVGYSLISNDSLRSQIMNVYEYDYPYYKAQTSTYRDLAIEFVTSINPNRFKSYEFSGSEPINIKNINADSEYYYHVKTIRNYNEYFLNGSLNKVQKEVEKTINMVEKELSK